MLLHTFHDVLPGTSIPRTYEEAYRDLEDIINKAQQSMNTLLHSPGTHIIIYNDLPWSRGGIAVLDKCILEKELCKPIGWGEYIVKIPEVPGIGLTTIDESNIITTGEAHIEEAKDVYILTLANNGLAACIEFPKKSEGIELRERICLFSGEETIRVDIDITNNQRLRYIKTWFNTSIYTDKAWFQIPFGAVQRPTMPKDPKEQALLYEAPALHWMDLSTEEKGLAIISFQKHGYTVLGNEIGLTLLKSTLVPNPYNDIGRHRIIYYIYPHRGNTWQANTPAKTVELWTPPKIIKTNKEYNKTLQTIKPEKKILVPGIRTILNPTKSFSRIGLIEKNLQKIRFLLKDVWGL